MHQLIARVYPLAVDTVFHFRCKAAQLDTAEAGINLVEHFVPANDGSLFILADYHPRGIVTLKRAEQAVECAELQHFAVFLHKLDLFAHRSQFVTGQSVDIQLIAERAEAGDIAARFKRRDAEHLMVGHDGYMRADAADRVAHGRAVLDLETFSGIRIITRPALRRIVQDARIKAAATRRTRLKQHLRERGRQAVVQIVHTEYVAVKQLTLLVGRQRSRKCLGDAAVHVPLDVRDLGLAQQLGHTLKNVINHFLAAVIEHILMAAVAHAAARRMDSPIRMRTVQVGILVYHFRLKPQAKLHAKRLNTVCQPGDAVRQAGAVGYPVSQTGAVIVSLTKPAIIKYEQFNALFMRSFRNIEQLLLIKIEVSTLPVVEQNRTRAITPVAMRQPLLIQAVEGLAHAVQAVVRIHHNRLGCLERLARRKLPRETKRMDTHSQAGDTPRVYLGLRQKVARVDQAKANGLALCFGRFAPLERDKRIVVVR